MLEDAAGTSRSGAMLRELYVIILFEDHWMDWKDDFQAQSSAQGIPKSSQSCPQVVPKMSPSRHQRCPVVPIRYTCSQQISPAIAFDIAVVAQKVKSSIEDQCDFKSGWWWWWVTNWSEWLLEVLPELISMKVLCAHAHARHEWGRPIRFHFGINITEVENRL